MLFFLYILIVIILTVSSYHNGFKSSSNTLLSSRLRLKMVSTDEPKKLQKVEALKLRSNYLREPLQEEMKNDEVFVSPDAVIVLKYHGSYMQDDRDKRTKDFKAYQFMLRLKSPCGETPPELYKKLDYMCDKYGQHDLRATTRQAFQIHGILKGDLQTVIKTIMDAGSSTIGACGDVSRNVMCTPAPFKTPEYEYARQYSKVMAELFKPQAQALTEIWNGEEKVADVEYWMKDLQDAGFDIPSAMRKDRGTGIITKDPVEPLYGNRYLPRKFKIAVTVPGDNSLDIYTNDIGLVVITDSNGKLEGFNVMAGGGMGRTHMKDTTFARVADHLGFVSKDDMTELMKSILATQRDHGNREVRPNARMKYLVHEKGIDGFRKLVEGYFGKAIEPWRPIKQWEYKDWMGWHEQGDGKLFLGINVEQGRIKDYDNGVKVKSAMKQIVDELNLHMILSPTQSIIFKDILPEQKAKVEAILARNGILAISEVNPLTRLSMACPALPLCGLAVAEAERRMPEWMDNMTNLLKKVGLEKETIMMRMTGCPNGCARPYMAELALVGDGPDMYQLWAGGSPILTRIAHTIANKVKWNDMDNTIETLLVHWRDNRTPKESFGDFVNRMGVENIQKVLPAKA